MSRDIRDLRMLRAGHNTEFANNVHELFSKRYGDVSISDIKVDLFNNTEFDLQSVDNVRKKDGFVFYSFSGYDGEYEPNIGFFRLYLIDDVLRNSSINEITYILPHIPYQRQDRMDKPRKPISARRTMQMLKVADSTVPTRVVTFDMHSGQLQGFVNYPVDNLEALPLFLDYFKNVGEDFVVASPDTGGVTRARKMAENIENSRLVVLGKTRKEAGEVEQIFVIGKEKVKDRDVILIDDMIDTGTTLIKGAYELKKSGARNIYACATHLLFSKKKDKKTDKTIIPEDEFRKSGMKIVGTNTIPRDLKYLEANEDWLTILPVDPIVSEAVYEIQTGGSISKLFDY